MKGVCIILQADLAERLGAEIIDAHKCLIIPGLVDIHVHLIGGGGEAGPASRTPESQLSAFLDAGITTVVGVLGTDCITRRQVQHSLLDTVLSWTSCSSNMSKALKSFLTSRVDACLSSSLLRPVPTVFAKNSLHQFCNPSTVCLRQCNLPYGDVSPTNVMLSVPQETLIAKCRALNEDGITAFNWAGSYRVPVATATGSIQSDLCLIASCVGVGEIAVSDHRSSAPTPHELARIARYGSVRFELELELCTTLRKPSSLCERIGRSYLRLIGPHAVTHWNEFRISSH